MNCSQKVALEAENITGDDVTDDVSRRRSLTDDEGK